MQTKTSNVKSVWKNPVKELLKKGKPAVGIVISVNSVEVATQAAALGFDFLWLEMEHTPVSLETVRNVVLATRGLPAIPIARPPVNELWMAKRVLDCGVLGVIFPFTSTPDWLGKLQPPAGIRHRDYAGQGRTWLIFVGRLPKATTISPTGMCWWWR